jgi:hypothetical protein
LWISIFRDSIPSFYPGLFVGGPANAALRHTLVEQKPGNFVHAGRASRTGCRSKLRTDPKRAPTARGFDLAQIDPQASGKLSELSKNKLQSGVEVIVADSETDFSKHFWPPPPEAGSAVRKTFFARAT